MIMIFVGFCWFLLVFVVFLMFFSATGEMKRE
jgi:hypothetical protein